jgi:hypothetical protein
MKKFNWLYLVIVIALVVSCNKPVDEKKTSTDDSASQNPVNLVPADTARTVISLAQLVLDTLIDSPTLLEETKGGNLKKLWKYDEQLYLKSSSSKKFIVTKEINPCCPCSSTDNQCCSCLIETDFAAVSDMEARASLDGTSIKVVPSPIAGIDLFTIPRGTTGTHTLRISGKSISEVTYSIIIENGTIRFK